MKLKTKNYKLKTNDGQSLVEVLVAMAIFVITSAAAFFLFFGGQSLSVDSSNAQFGLDYASEGIGATRSIRGRNWDELADGDHGLVFVSGQWQFSGDSDAKDVFTRKVNIFTIDENTKKASTTISWATDILRPQKIELVTLLTRWEDVLEESQNLGGDTGGGGLAGDWRNPITLGSVDIGAGGQATDLDVLNKIIYLTSVASDSKKSDFFIINATNGSNPVIASSLNTGPGLNAVDAANTYAYVANRDVNAQLQIIDVANINSPSLVASYKLPGVSGSGATGESIFFYDDKIYIGTKKASGPELHIIDVSAPSAPQSLGSKEINADVSAIYVKNNVAYLAVSDDDELEIYDISNPSQITALGDYDAPGSSEDGKAIHLVGNTLYLGRTLGGNHNDHHEFHILNVSNPAAVLNLGSKDLGANLNDLRSREYLAFLATSNPNQEFQVWDVSDPASINLWGSFNFPQDATGIDYEDNVVYVAVRSNDALRIITSQ